MGKEDKKNGLKNSKIGSWISKKENLCEIQKELKNELKKTYTYPEIAEYLQEFYPQIWEKMQSKYTDSKTLNKKKNDANSNKKNDTDSPEPSNTESRENDDTSDKAEKTCPTESESNDTHNNDASYNANNSDSNPITEAHIDEQCNTEPKEEVANLNNPVTEPQGPEVPSSQYKNLDNKFDYITNFLETLNKNINFLKNDINEVKKSVSKISTTVEDQDKIINENAAEFIKIYSSEKSRKTITVNKELFTKIIEQIQENDGIKNNDSKAIDVALLKILYSSQK